MKYARFEDLPVWQAAIALADDIYELTKRREFRGPGDLADQLRRAALSVSNNIAEGFEQGTTAQLLAALYVARGSAGEVRSMLRFCERARWMGNGVERAPVPAQRESEISNLKSEIPNAGRAATPESAISNLKSEISKAGRAASQEPPISPLKSQISRKAQASGAAASPESQISNLKSEISNLISLAESCSRQLRAWADKLQNSDIAGQRYLTDKTKSAYDNKKRADAFWKQCEGVVQRRLQESRDRHIASPSGPMMDLER